MNCVAIADPQLNRLAKAIAQRVGTQRFSVWFKNSTKLELKQDGLEIAVPNDFISEWISKNFARPIQEAANEVLGCSLIVRFSVVPQLFAMGDHHADDEDEELDDAARSGGTLARHAVPPRKPSRFGHRDHGVRDHDLPGRVALAGGANLTAVAPVKGGIAVAAALIPKDQTAKYSGNHHDHHNEARHGQRSDTHTAQNGNGSSFSRTGLAAPRARLRHDIESFVVGQGNQLAYNTALYVAEFPGAQYNPLFIHGACGLGKTHLLQGLCRRFQVHHPAKRWTYVTGEEFTNEFLLALRTNKLDGFRRKMRDLDLLVIDDVHFLAGKKATQEEFLHTFNAIEASGRQVVMASDAHPKQIEEFGESLVNRFVSGMVVRIDPPNFQTRSEILRSLSLRTGFILPDDVTAWIARRVTQNVRELEGAVTRVLAHVRLSGQTPDVAMAQAALGDLDRQMVAPVKPDSILQTVCEYFGVEFKDLMSGRRQRTISLARSVAMYLVRKTAKLSFPEIGQRLGKRNHSTVISACRRIERAIARNEPLVWTSSVGDRQEEAGELLARLEEHTRSLN